MANFHSTRANKLLEQSVIASLVGTRLHHVARRLLAAWLLPTLAWQDMLEFHVMFIITPN